MVTVLLSLTVALGLSGCMMEVEVPGDPVSSESVSSVSSAPSQSVSSVPDAEESKPVVSEDSASSAATSSPTVNVKSITFTEDTTTVFHNPDVGWVLYDNFLISKSESAAHPSCPTYGYDFPGVDYVMLKFTWADIEKTKGKYTFNEFDYIYDYWTKKGKTVTLGMSADSLLWYGQYATGVPKYVLEALPETSVQKRETIQNGASWFFDVCDANEPYYQERLKLFLEEMNRHMKETGREVPYMDLRGYGLWGEWHTGYVYKDLESKRTALDAVLRIWSEAFPDIWLALSYSYDPDEPYRNYSNQNFMKEFMEWSAFDHALKYKNITFRRDGCGGAIKYNERIFCENVFKTLDRGPFTSEAAGGYEGYDKSKYIIEDGLKLHPNYFTIIGWTNQQAKAFIEQQPELFNYALNNMGYRFTATGAQYPDALLRGQKISISATWKNQAVGRAARNYQLYAVLTDEKGEKVSSFSIGDTGCSKWVKGKEYSETVTGTVPGDLKAGTYPLNLAMYDPTTEQFIDLAINEKNGENPWYVLGKVVVA